jgi:hypothetical protein
MGITSSQPCDVKLLFDRFNHPISGYSQKFPFALPEFVQQYIFLVNLIPGSNCVV